MIILKGGLFYKIPLESEYDQIIDMPLVDPQQKEDWDRDLNEEALRLCDLLKTYPYFEEYFLSLIFVVLNCKDSVQKTFEESMVLILASSYAWRSLYLLSRHLVISEEINDMK